MKNKYLVILMIFLIIISFLLGRITIKNTFANEELCTYVYLSCSGDEVNVDMIFAFNSNNECTDCRVLYEFLDEETAQEQYDNWNIEESNLKNVTISKNLVTFNDSTKIGETKEEILNSDFGQDYLVEL